MPVAVFIKQRRAFWREQHFLIIFSVGELRLVKVVVGTFFRHQCRVTADFNDVAVCHDENLVGVFNGGEAVGDDEARLAVHHLNEAVRNLFFSQRVNGTGRLIQNKQWWIFNHRPRNGQQLALAV